VVATAKAELAEATFVYEWATGPALSQNQAIDDALSDIHRAE
jgi:hypothetical protein